MENPTISVLMGVYNCASTVEEAVRCIIDQTYPHWELIICDDCSSDDTYRVVAAMAEREPRIVLIRNLRNLGLAPTLNHCLKYARGTYTARMDGDDICDPTRFEKELAVLEQSDDFVLVSCNMHSFDDEGVYGLSRYAPYPQPVDFMRQSPFCHAGCMMRRDVLVQLGGYSESESVRRIEDVDLWFRLYLHGYRGCNIQEVLYSMRDDRQAFRRRKLRFRLNSTRLKYRMYRDFRLPLKYFPTVFVPVIKGLLPEKLYIYLRKRKFQRQEERARNS